MQLVHSHKTSSYTFLLTEDEWYSGTEQQKEAWINQIMREGKEAKCNNLNILVKPDSVMSISPVAHTHSVFCHVIRASDIEREKFRVALLEVYARSPLNGYEKAAIAKEVFEL